MNEQRKLAAIMFTDIAGYTALMGKDEQKAMQIIHKNRNVLMPLIKQFNGEWLKEMGDGTLSSFYSAVDAVNCAMEIQRSLKDDPDLNIRIAIHVGEVVLKEKDIYGDAVNVASRIEPLTPPGGICISERVYSNIKNQPGIKTHSIGKHNLKNVDEEIEIYSVDIDEDILPQTEISIPSEPAPEGEKSLADVELATEDNLQQFRSLLLEGSIEEAVQLQNQDKFNDKDILPHIKDAFITHKQAGNFRHAFEIAKRFKSIQEDPKPICIEEWNRLNNEGKFETAAQWAKEQGLSNVEIEHSSIMAYKKYIQDGKVEDALRVLDNYILNKEDLLGETIAEFDRAYTSGEYHKAAFLGKKFGLSENQTFTSAIQACTSAVKNEDFELAEKIIKNFNPFSDDTFKIIQEKDAESFLLSMFKNFIEPAFSNRNFNLMKNFTKWTNLLNQPFENNLLKNFLQKFLGISIAIHNKLLQNNDVKSAQFILDSFNLFESRITSNLYNSLIEASENYHNSLFKNGDVLGAISFKNKYGLFDTHILKNSVENVSNLTIPFVISKLEIGDISTARNVINEYKIPRKKVNEIIFATIINLNNKQKYNEANAIQREFWDKDIKKFVLDKFYELMDKKRYKEAAEFSRRFRLNKSYTEESIYKAWKEEFLSHRFSAAFDLKRICKISKKRTLPLATITYWDLIKSNKYRMAGIIRQSYGVRINLVQLIKEFFRKLFYG